MKLTLNLNLLPVCKRLFGGPPPVTYYLLQAGTTNMRILRAGTTNGIIKQAGQ